MTHKEFELFLKMLDTRLNNTLTKKGKFYTNKDRFSNFKSAALMNEETPEQSLWGMVSKHIIALKDMIKSGDDYPMEKWVEVAGDVINYMKLLLGIIAEKQGLMDWYKEVEGNEE